MKAGYRERGVCIRGSCQVVVNAANERSALVERECARPQALFDVSDHCYGLPVAVGPLLAMSATRIFAPFANGMGVVVTTSAVLPGIRST